MRLGFGFELGLTQGNRILCLRKKRRENEFPEVPTSDISRNGVLWHPDPRVAPSVRQRLAWARFPWLCYLFHARSLL